MTKQYSTAAELLAEISNMTVSALREVARDFGIVPRNRKRDELIEKIMAAYNGEIERETPKKSGRPPRGKQVKAVEQETSLDQSQPNEAVDNVDPSWPRSGILEVISNGTNTSDCYGFVRTNNFSPTTGRDYYVSSNIITRLNLRSGDKVKVVLHQFPDRAAPTVLYVLEINDEPCGKIKRALFDSLEPCFPKERINLKTERTDYSLRMLDLVAPIGKGQRGLIVSPPKAGKTILLKKIAMAVKKNHPEIHLTVLLIDERPEEVTDFKESVDCEVAYSTFDQQPSNHCRVAELVFANAKRRVEQGQDVMILLDSITRLGRAYNQTAEQSGRTLTGGLDISALQEPKKMFGAGRNVRNGGSLTIMATALIDTGSKMDDIIYEEFKGTGNMEIQLDRRMSEKRIFPAIDLNRSSTRRDDLLLTPDQLEGMYLVRRMLSREDTVMATEELLEVVMTTADNDETIDSLQRLARSAAIRHSMKK